MANNEMESSLFNFLDLNLELREQQQQFLLLQQRLLNQEWGVYKDQRSSSEYGLLSPPYLTLPYPSFNVLVHILWAALFVIVSSLA